jgi:putative IMPACT (imprinted ancient) family translation regulator
MGILLWISNRTETITYRANDDVEPSNSAGMPIWPNSIFDLTNILIVVMRILYGTKLGATLISSYKTTQNDFENLR